MASPQQPDSASPVIHWHPAFFQAIRLELADYQDVLEFKYEYQLTTEPLRVDTLIILKPPAVRIDKNIARIFRAVNLCEYKSPDDYLSVKDFFKVYAYACLYAAITPEADMADMSLTFVGTGYPRKLVKYLREVRRYGIEETGPGIYRVSGDYLPIQIIESRKLLPQNNLWLKSLGKGLESAEADGILKVGREQKNRIPVDAYFDAVFHANPKTFQEVLSMTNNALTFEDVLMEAGFIPKWLDQGREEVARNLLRKGWSVEETAETTELPVERVRLLYTAVHG